MQQGHGGNRQSMVTGAFIHSIGRVLAAEIGRKSQRMRRTVNFCNDQGFRAAR